MNELRGESTGSVRVLGREVGQVLTDQELESVSGGPFSDQSLGTDQHGGTCTNEVDCDA